MQHQKKHSLTANIRAQSALHLVRNVMNNRKIKYYRVKLAENRVAKAKSAPKKHNNRRTGG